ncbi:MAG: BRCT domain-containing protein, partial [Anaerolineaceae bacterium]
ARYGLAPLAYIYLDTSKLIRSSFSRRLSAETDQDEILHFMHIPLQYPDALVIARVVGQMVLEICQISGLSVGGWVREVDQFYHLTAPKNPSKWHDRTGNPNGRLYGHTVVFVGVFAIPRHVLAILASDRGCHVSSHINKNTTLLAMGRIDTASPFYQDDEIKLTKTKKCIESGAPIQLLTEAEFFNLLEPPQPDFQPSMRLENAGKDQHRA